LRYRTYFIINLHTSPRSGNSTALAINPIATTVTSPSTSATTRPHTAIVDAFEYDSYIDSREGHPSSNQTVRHDINSQRYRSLKRCLCCCCFIKPWKHGRNICATRKQNDTSEKCQTTSYSHNGEEGTVLNRKELYNSRKRRTKLNAFRSAFWTLIVMVSVVAGGFFLSNNTSEFLNATVQTTLDGSVPLSEVFFPSVVVCNINQIRKSFFAELGFYENDTLVRIMYEDFIKGTIETERAERNGNEGHDDPKRTGFYEVSPDTSI